MKEGNPSIISTLLSFVGISVPLGILVWVWKEKSLGDLIQFNSESDIVFLPRNNLIVESAKKRISFSYEHYTNLSDHFFELNLVLDEQRIRFASSSQKNGFAIVIKEIEKMGFSVSRNKIKIS
jgi:hypothetical protein